MSAAIDDLCATYRKKGLALALGAGLTLGKYIPGWTELLERIFDSARHRDPNIPKYTELAEPLREHLIAASIAKQTLQENFVPAVREALYSRFPLYRADLSQSVNKKRLVKLVEHDFKTLTAVAAFLTVKSRGRFMPNPLVHGVVTTNFDTVLREFVECKYSVPILRTVERASSGSLAGRISLYYAHGHLRFDKHFGRLTKEGSDQLILAEEEFFNAYASPHAIFNYTWLYLLREHPMLFIGFSFSDPNVRRLLWLSYSERKTSYASEGVNLKPSKLVRHFAIWEHRANKNEERHIEAWLANLGIRLLWVRGYGEIGEILKNVYEAGSSRGQNWMEVYHN